MARIEIQKELCNNCGVCVTECPDGIFQRENEAAIIAPHETCLSCYHCLAICPTGAIRWAEIPAEDYPPIERLDLPSPQSLILAFRERRSSRHFAERPVPRELIETLIDGARWAPSAHNAQDVDWLAIDDAGRIKALSDEIVRLFARSASLLDNPAMRLVGPLILGRDMFQMALENRAGLQSLLDKSARGDDVIFYHAPVVLVGHTPAGNSLGRDNAIYQAYNIMLLAERLRLGTCQIGYLTAALDINVLGLNRPLLQRLNLPTGRKAQIALVVGYPRVHFRRVVPRKVPGLEWNNSLS